MPTKQQLEEAIRRAHAAGDAKAVQILGRQLKGLGAAPKKERSFFEKIGDLAADARDSVTNTLVGVPEGVYNLAASVTDPIAKKTLELVGGKDYADKAMQKEQERRRQYSKTARELINAGKPVKEMPIATDIGQATGGMLAPIPGGKKLQAGGKIAKGIHRAIQGAAGGAAVSEPGEDVGANIAIGAGANVVLPPVLGAIAKPLVSAGSKGVGYLRGLGKPPVAQTIDDLGPDAVMRAGRFKDLGIENPTTAMVTRDEAAANFEDFARQSPQGRTLADQIADVQRKLVAKGEELVGGVRTPETTGKAAQDFLETKQREMQDLTNKLYDDVRDTRGDELVGRLDILREKLSDPDLMHDPAFDQMRKGITRRMKDLGLISKDGRISKGITLNQAERFRSFIGKLGNGAESKTRRARAILIDALDDDVVDVIGDDAFKAARTSAKEGFEQFRKNFAGKIIQEDIPAEKVVERIVKGNTSLQDIRTLKNTFSTGTPEQIAKGKAAWAEIEAQSMQDLLTSAEGGMNGKKLLDNFTAQQAKLREILPPDRFDELQKLVFASRDATTFPSGLPTQGSANLEELFKAVPPTVKRGWINWLKTSAAHSAAFMTGGPAANVALGVGQQTLSSNAQQAAANLFIKQIEMAKSPAAAAKALAQAKEVAKTNPIVNDFLQKRGLVGSAAAAATGE